jgi:hypothetical protein
MELPRIMGLAVCAAYGNIDDVNLKTRNNLWPQILEFGLCAGQKAGDCFGFSSGRTIKTYTKTIATAKMLQCSNQK